MEARRFEVRFKGMTPLVMNNPDAMLGPKPDTRDHLEWEKAHLDVKLYKNVGGDLVIPARCVKKTFQDACRFSTMKPKGAFKSYAALFQAAMYVEDDVVLDVPRDKVVPWVAICNLIPSKGPKGPRGAKCRPLLNVPWSGHTYLTVVDDSITGNVLSEICGIAGKLCGLLDARNIGMGRAEVTVEQR